MGAQIAAHLANAGLQVNLLDIAPEEGPKNAIVEAAFKRASKLRPEPMFTDRVAECIKLGNFDEHLDWIAESDWVIEVVVERLDIKQSVMQRIEKYVNDGAVISTNTSGLPIHKISEGRSMGLGGVFLVPIFLIRLDI